MMRVAVFIDGKNFYAGWRERADGRRIDFNAMASWVVKRAGGQWLWGAYYYTGVETGPAAGSEGQQKLTSFLDMLEVQPGYFVHRFPRSAHSFPCAACGAENRFTQEKEVDTTMVADILRFAAVAAFDILVLMSGDADYAPAVEGVRAIGRQAYVASWGGAGLSARIRKAAFDHIDLLDGLGTFERLDDGVPASVPSNGQAIQDPPSTQRGAQVGESLRRLDDGLRGGIATMERDVFLDEVRRAEEKFHGGYVGANYFVTRWASEVLDESPDTRRRVLDALVEEGRVEVYAAPDGKKAIRSRDGGRADASAEPDPGESPEESVSGRNCGEAP